MKSMSASTVLLCLPCFALAGPLDAEPGSLQSGLVGQYRSLADKQAVVYRIDAKPAFYFGRSSPHPRIPPGPFEVVWNGVIRIQDAAPLKFSAFVCGEVLVQVDGKTVLEGRGQTDTSEFVAKESFQRETGDYRIAIRFRSLADVPSRLQLSWEARTFAREPIPAWRFRHVAADVTPAVAKDQLAEQGRIAAGKYGCARCHQNALPAITDPPPGPSLADVSRRISRNWLFNWLADPAKVRADAHMPALFTSDRAGFVDRWLIAQYLTRNAGNTQVEPSGSGDHRAGRLAFLSLGCATCHFLPEVDRAEQRDLGRIAFTGLGDRMRTEDITAFLGNPHGRYPDGRMPRLPVPSDAARHIAAYLLLWSKPTVVTVAEAPKSEELQQAFKRLGAHDQASAAAALIRNKGCSSCHSGLGTSLPLDAPLRSSEVKGCLSGKTLPRYALDGPTRNALTAYLAVSGREKHTSPFASRQLRLEQAGCVRCHQRDTMSSPPIEEVGSTLGGGFLQELPFQRTPRLTNAHQKYTRAHLLATVREGIAGLRNAGYSYRMPAFGADAELLVQALAEADGELPAAADPAERPVADPTIGTLNGPNMVGSQGYSCISCHVWNGRQFVQADPVAVGPDLTRTAGRIRRDWFDRFLEAPQRFHPGTPMPAIFERGQRALLASVLEGDAAKQRDAFWSYFAQGKIAPEPRPAPPLPIEAPAPGAPPLIAQIPIRLANGSVVESICLLTGENDLLIYDLGVGAPMSFQTGAQIGRTVQGRQRQFLALGTTPAIRLSADQPLQLIANGKAEPPSERILHGYDRLHDGFRIRWQLVFTSGRIELDEAIRVSRDGADRIFLRELQITGMPKDGAIELRTRAIRKAEFSVLLVRLPEARVVKHGETIHVSLIARRDGSLAATLRDEMPPAQSAAIWKDKPFPDSTPIEGSLERPGYRAIAYPRPKTISGEDRIMPVALAAHPRDGRVFVASLKTGEIFVLHDADGTGKSARFENYGNGLFQDALSLLAEDDALNVLHRRNLTRIAEGNGQANRFERVALLPQAVADSYDYAYGLVRDKSGGFVISYAQYGDAKMTGAGGSLSLEPGKPPREIAFGMRNPLGWCAGPDGEIFFTDNQGDWVASNKLCHVVEGRYYGYPNRAQKQHLTKPAGKAAIWVPYGWARSINGVAYDNSGGKFGPFAGQLFMAELMFGGAIVRANVEKVNGEYQGACFPFWGKGLMGPVSLAFDPKGRLFVGGITEPGWMAQPDRGALFRIDFTGQTPFEMQSIHVLPHGFRIAFTTPIDRKLAADPASFRLEHYRYEYTGAYGSPELDRTAVTVKRASVSADGLSVELTASPLVKDRVYTIGAHGVRSAKGDALVNPTGAYTLNEIPIAKP